MLVFTCVGYVPVELSAKAQLGDIKLEELNNSIEGIELVVNTGYIKISKARAAGSFAQINAEDMESRLQTYFLDRRECLLPGMNLCLNKAAAKPDE